MHFAVSNVVPLERAHGHTTGVEWVRACCCTHIVTSSRRHFASPTAIGDPINNIQQLYCVRYHLHRTDDAHTLTDCGVVGRRLAWQRPVIATWPTASCLRNAAALVELLWTSLLLHHGQRSPRRVIISIIIISSSSPSPLSHQQLKPRRRRQSHTHTHTQRTSWLLLLVSAEWPELDNLAE